MVDHGTDTASAGTTVVNLMDNIPGRVEFWSVEVGRGLVSCKYLSLGKIANLQNRGGDGTGNCAPDSR